MVLSIAGSDPSGGAGIQADLKTFEALGVEGCAIPVALTVQNGRGVTRVEALSSELITEQLDAVLSDIDVRAVKIGMLANGEVVRAVANALRRYAPPFVVLDPVICSTSGARLLSVEGVDALRTELLPLVTLVTPNAAEAGALAGSSAPTNPAESRLVAACLRSLGASNVVVTGGHIDGDQVVDVFVGDAGSADARAARVRVSTTHGTGCRFSSAVAVFVARDVPLIESCGRAQRHVADWLARAGR